MSEKIFNFVDGKKPVKVGQQIYMSKRQGWGAGNKTIEKIGRKLIHLCDGSSFYLTGGERSDYCHSSLYSSEKVFQEIKEFESKRDAISKAFDWSRIKKISKEDIEAVYDIVKKYEVCDEIPK